MRPSLLALLALLAACDDGAGPKDDAVDADRDGYDADSDCDDGDGRVSPDADEVPYDGIDNDCDPATPDDDLDGDGFGLDEDCDDTDADVHPGADEVPYDGVDNDCSSDTPGDDLDGDGFASDTDCDDANADVNPDATEACNGLDDDCDGEIDEAGGGTWYADADGDGFGDPAAGMTSCDGASGAVPNGDDCDDSEANAFPGNPETCDEVDNDCDGAVDEGVTTTWYQDVDGDGWGVADSTQEACAIPTGYAAFAEDCDDTSADVSPDEAERCNAVDDDCDGTVDEDDALDASTWYADLDGDGYGDPDTALAACEPPPGYVADARDCDDTDASRNPATTWYIDFDGDGYGSTAFTLTQCTQPAGYLPSAEDCADTDPAINPAATEVCNALDDDCDGLTDDADPSVDTSTGDTWYTDADGDGYGTGSGTLACAAPPGTADDATDCDDGNADANPGEDEGWFDGVDGDCDGAEDPDACDDDPPAATVAVDGTCTWTPAVGSFDPVQEWAVTSFATEPNSKHVIMTPVVGQLTDDDGDGDLDADDIPDIAFVTQNRTTGSTAGALRVLSGGDGSHELSVYGATYGGNTYYPFRYTNLALGDIDNDGEPEIVATLVRSSSCYVGAYSTSGTLEWVTTATHSCRSHAPALADLEGDGTVEVIFGRNIINGEDGTDQAAGGGGRGYYSGYSNGGYMSFAADVDGDGVQEVVAGSSIYTSTGATVCSTGYDDGYPGVADFDGDGDAEMVVVAGGTIRVFSHTCTRLASWSVYGGGNGGPPTIADYDGDGVPEIGLPGDEYYSVYEVTGTRLWSKAIADASSHSTGSSVFDFDGDGRAEVVYADEDALWVFDGATGTTLLRETSHESGTVHDYPVIADVDGDGNAEIVVPNDNGAYGIQVFGDANDNWVSARTVWNQHAYSIVNVEDDLSIPAFPEPNWPTYNSFRQGAPGSFNATDAPNVYPVAYAACQDECGDGVTVYAQVGNGGLVRAASSVTVHLYGEDAGGSRTHLVSDTLGDNLDSGELSAPFVFALDADEVTPYARLVVVVDEEGATNECDESDNEATVDIDGVC